MAACWVCQKTIDDADAYCRYCGKGQGPNIGWYYHPAAMVFLAIFALGPFVLPLVWKSPKLTERGRWVGTILVGALTVYMAWSVYAVFKILLPALSAAALD